MMSDSHHQAPEVEVANTTVSPLFGRLVAGVIGGTLLVYTAGGVCAVAMDPISLNSTPDFLDVLVGVPVLILLLAIFVHSILFAVRSRRTAKIWRILILRSSTVAFATPLATVVALIVLGICYEGDPSLGPIMYFYAGGFGIVAGIVLRVIGLCIDRTPVPIPEPELPAEPNQQSQKLAGPPICSACGSVLLQMACDDLVLDVCQDGCGGIWFDNFEVRQATESISAIEEDWLLRATTTSPVHVDPSPKRPCPKCDGTRMLRHQFSDSCHIEIDECPRCGGIWLDAGEFEQIQASLAQQEESTPNTALDPEAALLMAGLVGEMKQERQQTQARRSLHMFLGRRYCTSYRNCKL